MKRISSKTAFIVASMFIASIVIVVVGVLAIAGGTQTTGFSITYDATKLAATIVASGKNGTDDVIMTSDDQITHTATITPSTTNETIPAPSINKGNPLAFKQVNGLPQNIEFYFEVTSNRVRGFACTLTTTDITLLNASINMFTGLTKETATDAYTAGHEIYLGSNGTTKVVKIVLSVINIDINASASGNIVLSLGEPLNLGTAASPYMLDSEEEFNTLATATGFANSATPQHFRQTKDLTFTTAPTLVDLFGTYDGDNHTITITGTDARDAIFNILGSSSITTATIKNLNVINNDCVGTDTQYCGGIVRRSYGTITNCSFAGEITFTSSSWAYAGGICGISEGGVISNCYNTGSINVSNEGESALAGGISGGGGTITNCYNTGSVTASSTSSSAYAGGICGRGSTITNCYNTGSVTANASSVANAGGIEGAGSDIITNCYNTGSVTANANNYAYAGGICGYSSGSITNCYNTGSVTATSTSRYASAGGICGYYGTITNCYNLGIVTAPTGTTKYIGGISGYCGTCTSCYWASNTASFGIGTGTGTGNNTGATSFAVSGTHSYAQATFAGWTFGTYGIATDGWVWGAGKSMVINGTTFAASSLPRLWWEEL